MRRAKPPGEQQNPGGTSPLRAGRRPGRATPPVQSKAPRQGTGSGNPGTTRPGRPRKGKGNNPRRRGATGGKVPRKVPEPSEVWRLLGWREGKPPGNFHWIKVHNGCSETQLSTTIDGRMAKQQPTSEEPEKLKA